MPTVRVALEAGDKRVFAIAIDWPGWARAATDEETALASLAGVADRYAAVAGRAGVAFPASGSVTFDVVERLTGGAGTDFGVPSAALADDDAGLDRADLKRIVSLLHAAWARFDDAASAAQGLELTTGPRGGGRSLAKIVDHVLEAEEAYLTKLGSRSPRPRSSGSAEMGAVRERASAALAARVRGEAVPDPARTQKLWSPRYFVRRSAWHALDHAWEIVDRSSPPGG